MTEVVPILSVLWDFFQQEKQHNTNIDTRMPLSKPQKGFQLY